MLGFLTLLATLWLAPPCDPGVCTCWDVPRLKVTDPAVAAVFSGTVVSVQPSGMRGGLGGRWPQVRVLLRVDRAWKGVESKTVAVLTPANEATCGVWFQPGQAYLVYATAQAAQGALTTGLCSGTAPLDEAEADLRALGEPERRWR